MKSEKNKILKDGKSFHHYKVSLSIAVYVNIIPKGLNYYKNIEIECTFRNKGNNYFKLKKDVLLNKIQTIFGESDNQKIIVNHLPCFTLDSGVHLEEYPNFIILERTLKQHRDIIIESLL